MPRRPARKPRGKPAARPKRRARPPAKSPTRPAAATAPTSETVYDTSAYWLMPHGLLGLLVTVFWSAAARQVAEGRASSFPLLAPGKLSRGLGQHTFWRGVLWGRRVALQGDSTFAKFDLFEETADRLLYWGTFRGNGYYGSEESHSFSAPFVWMNRWMRVGDATEQRVTDSVLDPRLRRIANSGTTTLRVQIVAHFDSWPDPDSGTLYRDVLEVHYWSRYPDEASREIYHLGRGLGTIRFETRNRLEPSGVQYQYAQSFEQFSPTDRPTLPWYDPTRNPTHVVNGFCEDFLAPPVQGGAVDRYLRGWNGTPDAVVTTDAPDEGTGPWRVALRGTTGGGDATADFIVSSDWIPVTPGRRYRLSGSVWRVSERDNVYLDFNDGVGQGGGFKDAQAMATRSNVWERVASETTVGASTTAIKVRFVRDGANEGNAYGDGITLQRLD